MKKAWIIIGLLLAVFIIIQFFQPEKNDQLIDPQNDIVFQLDIPIPVKKTLVDACYDCHSNKTVYPFYSKFAPISWLLAKDIRNGKEHLNFSEWAGYDKRQQIKLLTNISDEVSEGAMPLKSYVFMHSRAVLNEKQVDAINQWTEAAAEGLMGKKE